MSESMVAPLKFQINKTVLVEIEFTTKNKQRTGKWSEKIAITGYKYSVEYKKIT